MVTLELWSADPATLRRELRKLDELGEWEQSLLLLVLAEVRQRADLPPDVRDGASYRIARIVVRSPEWLLETILSGAQGRVIAADDLDLYWHGYPEPRPLPEEERARWNYLRLRLGAPELIPGLL